MAIPVHTKPTKSNVAWPTPPTNAITSNNSTGPDRLRPRRRYRRGSGAPDRALAGKPRVIITNDGISLGQSDTLS